MTTCGSTDTKFTFKMYKFSGYKPGHQAYNVPPTTIGTNSMESLRELPPGEEEVASLPSQSSTQVEKPSLTLLVPQKLLSAQFIKYLTSGETIPMELASVPSPNTQGDESGDDVDKEG